jgi:mannose-6-phosphate isomerase-like protein (cupin superfamily)
MQPADGLPAKGASGAATLIKASGDDTGDLVAAFEQVVPKQSGPPLHIHHDCSEAFYILRGEFRFEIGSQVATALEGTFLFVPRGVRHTYKNVGDESGRIFFWFSPAARMASYFKELAKLPSAPSEHHSLDEIAARHAVEIVREPPTAKKADVGRR